MQVSNDISYMLRFWDWKSNRTTGHREDKSSRKIFYTKSEYPKSIHQVSQFLGLTGYFRQFVQGYAAITKPLTELLKKNTRWRWTETEMNTFQSLQEQLLKRPYLFIFDSSLQTEVHTYASMIGSAAILLQRQNDNQLHPVIYQSRQTIDAFLWMRNTSSRWRIKEIQDLCSGRALYYYEIFRFLK